MSAFTMLIVMAIFGLIGSPLILLTFALVFLQGLVFGSLGMIATSMSPSFFFFNYHFTIIISPMIFLSGIFFPLERFGEGFRWFTWCLPLTHVVRGARALNEGNLLWAFPGAIVWLAVVAALLIPIAVFAIRRRLVK